MHPLMLANRLSEPRRRVIVIYELNVINRVKYDAWKNTRLSYRSMLILSYTNDMPKAFTSGNLCMYTDDTTIYFIGSITTDGEMVHE